MKGDGAAVTVPWKILGFSHPCRMELSSLVHQGFSEEETMRDECFLETDQPEKREAMRSHRFQ